MGEGAENARDGEPAEGAAEEGVGEGEGECEVAEGTRSERAEQNRFEGGGAATGEATSPDLRGDAGAREDKALPEKDGESDEQRPVGHGGRWERRRGDDRGLGGGRVCGERLSRPEDGIFNHGFHGFTRIRARTEGMS